MPLSWPPADRVDASLVAEDVRRLRSGVLSNAILEPVMAGGVGRASTQLELLAVSGDARA